ncbi:MAG: copper transport protein, partial [Pseudonocardiales bacterium]|nr:copper transport protein [Pseudonocardiales bacterium]
DGTYTVAWRVESDDSHPVSGSLRFSIGAPSRVSGAIPALGGPSGSSAATTAIPGVLRGLSYLGLALGPGILLVVLALWPAGLRDSRARRLMWSGVAALGLSTLGEVLLEPVWVNGLSLPDTWAGGAGLDNQSARFDAVLAARFYLLLAFGVLLAVASTPRRTIRRPLLLTTVLVTSSLLVTWPLTGHAAVGRWVPLSVAVDLAHLTAMTVWLGGLALLAVSLSRASQARELATMLPGFSRLAFGSVVVLAVTGTYQAWRQLDTLGALFGSPFGRLLLVKLGSVAVLVSLGGLARRWVHRRLSPVTASVRAVGGGDTLLVDRSPQPSAEQVRMLRRGLVAEVMMGAVVLGLTAVLVASVPVAPAANQRAAQTSRGAPGGTRVTIYPAASRAQAPDVRGQTLDRDRLALADLRGKVVVVNVWGSWCQPCRKEAPDLARAAREMAPQGVRFVGIDARDSDAAARAFVRSFNIPYPSLIDDDGRLTLEFAGVIPLSAVPSTVVIDRKGTIAAKVVGIITYGTLRGLIDDMLAEAPSTARKGGS